MESKTKFRILGIVVIIALAIILFPLLRAEKAPNNIAMIKAPPFPEQTAQVNPQTISTPTENTNLAQSNTAEVASSSNQEGTTQPVNSTETGTNVATTENANTKVAAESQQTAATEPKQNPQEAVSNLSSNAANQTQVNASPIPPVASAAEMANANETADVSKTTPQEMANNDSNADNLNANPVSDKQLAHTEETKPVANAEEEKKIVELRKARTEKINSFFHNSPAVSAKTHKVNNHHHLVTNNHSKPIANHHKNLITPKPVVASKSKLVKKTVHSVAQASVAQVPLTDNGLVSLNKAVYVIQLGSFKNKTNALMLANRLRAKGYRAFIQKIAGLWETNTRVYVGPENHRRSARALAARLANDMHVHGIVISYKPLALS